MIAIVQGKKISEGAKALQFELAARGVVVQRKRYDDIAWSRYIEGGHSIYKNTLFVNWGDAHNMGGLVSYVPRLSTNKNFILNVNTYAYTDKKRFFQNMTQFGLQELCPKYFLTKDEAAMWLYANPENRKLCIRHKTSSSGSNGLEIVTANDLDEEIGLPVAPLYTQYIPKKHEFRCHIFRYGDDVWQQKKLRSGTNNPDFTIRNHMGGWVFARQNIEVPATAKLVINSFKDAFFQKMKLDFAAVDIVWNQAQNRAYILEINSAPGLEGQTVKDYADFVVSAQANLIGQ